MGCVQSSKPRPAPDPGKELSKPRIASEREPAHAGVKAVKKYEVLDTVRTSKASDKRQKNTPFETRDQ